jgi:hypothetical protein
MYILTHTFHLVRPQLDTMQRLGATIRSALLQPPTQRDGDAPAAQISIYHIVEYPQYRSRHSRGFLSLPTLSFFLVLLIF